MYTVREFDVAGDGITDDTAALQHAINYSGGEIVFPKGNYRITAPLQLDLTKLGRVSISGSGGLAKVIMDGEGPAFMILGGHTSSADPTSYQPHVWNEERCPTIDGIEIEGTHPQANGIHIEGAVMATLTRLLIRKVHTAIRLHKRARNVLIDACHLYYNTGIGVHLDEVNLHQIIVSSSHISYCRLGGIRIDGGEVRNFQITGNDIEYNNPRTHLNQFPDDAEAPQPTAEIYIDIRKGSVREGTITSNTIQATESSGGSNIRMIGSERDEGFASLWSITGNLIGNQEINVHLTNVWGVVISGNNIYGGTARNLHIEGSRNVVVSGNLFAQTPDFNQRLLANGIRIENSINCTLNANQIQDPQEAPKYKPAPLLASREGLVELVNCSAVNVTGCQILDSLTAGLLIDSCRDTSVSQCQIFNQRPESRMTAGIRVRGDLENVVVSNCQVRGAATQSLEGSPHPGLTLMNNVMP